MRSNFALKVLYRVAYLISYVYAFTKLICNCYRRRGARIDVRFLINVSIISFIITWGRMNEIAHRINQEQRKSTGLKKKICHMNKSQETLFGYIKIEKAELRGSRLFRLRTNICIKNAFVKIYWKWFERKGSGLD